MIINHNDNLIITECKNSLWEFSDWEREDHFEMLRGEELGSISPGNWNPVAVSTSLACEYSHLAPGASCVPREKHIQFKLYINCVRFWLRNSKNGFSLDWRVQRTYCNVCTQRLSCVAPLPLTLVHEQENLWVSGYHHISQSHNHVQ